MFRMHFNDISCERSSQYSHNITRHSSSEVSGPGSFRRAGPDWPLVPVTALGSPVARARTLSTSEWEVSQQSSQAWPEPADSVWSYERERERGEPQELGRRVSLLQSVFITQSEIIPPQPSGQTTSSQHGLWSKCSKTSSENQWQYNYL